jgi:hypothetical protein
MQKVNCLVKRLHSDVSLAIKPRVDGVYIICSDPTLTVPCFPVSPMIGILRVTQWRGRTILKYAVDPLLN